MKIQTTLAIITATVLTQFFSLNASAEPSSLQYDLVMTAVKKSVEGHQIMVGRASAMMGNPSTRAIGYNELVHATADLQRSRKLLIETNSALANHRTPPLEAIDLAIRDQSNATSAAVANGQYHLLASIAKNIAELASLQRGDTPGTAALAQTLASPVRAQIATTPIISTVAQRAPANVSPTGRYINGVPVAPTGRYINGTPVTPTAR